MEQLFGPLVAKIVTLEMVAIPLFIGIICEAIKRIAYGAWPPIKGKYWFTEVFLYIFPAVVGGLLGKLLFGKYPFPDFISTSEAAIIVCSIAGAGSGFVYNRGKAWARKKLSSSQETSVS